MTNSHVRLISAAIGLLAGAILCTTSRVDINVSLGVLIASAILFVVEYFRLQRV